MLCGGGTASAVRQGQNRSIAVHGKLQCGCADNLALTAAARQWFKSVEGTWPVRLLFRQLFRKFYNNMKKVNVALVRLLQFVVFVFFTFMVLAYFGVLLLVPLDALSLLIKLLTAVGFNGVIAALIGVPVVAYLGLIVYRTPGLVKMLLDIGMDLVNAGKSRVDEFNKLAETVKGEQA